ncbi:MAG: hypothetical protein RIR62_694, partial [Pseudomonadota bacterium]
MQNQMQKTWRTGKERGRDMQDIAELERRISAALGRIGAGIEALAAPA